MRLHLIIQRHGLPVTRILWTTSPPSLFEQHARHSSSLIAAPTASAITSSRAPNALYATGGYTIAQLLEDVNEVVPLETEPAVFDQGFSGQWGLEDYVVEVCGSECLHFMEVEGLLRDGDEVLIRALQISDLRARRLSGRHQISTDGRHLIDGVPFGKPFLKRPTSSRPAITIPPRKKRRTSFATWDHQLAYEDEDTEWAPPPPAPGPSDISVIKAKENTVGGGYDASASAAAPAPTPAPYQGDDFEDYHDAHEDTGDGTVIRHVVAEADGELSESDDADVSDIEDGDLMEELRDLKADTENVSPMPESDIAADEQSQTGYQLRTRQSASQLQLKPRKSSLAHANMPAEGDSSRRDSKAVRFGQEEAPSEQAPTPAPNKRMAIIPPAEKSDASDIDSESESISSDSDSGSDSSSSDSSSDAGSDAENVESSSDSDSDDSSSDSDSSSASEPEDHDMSAISTRTNPPGLGSARTKKSNQRTKLRRRLAKLKELGHLTAEADFAALRKFEEENPDWNDWYGLPEPPQEPEVDPKEQEKAEFEAKRQKLLQDIASGGVDISATSEKENLPPVQSEQTAQKSTEADAEDDVDEEPAPKRRTLDIASSRRLLFGSLGVRTPRNKEDEEATRKKLAGKRASFVPQNTTMEEQTHADAESDGDETWQDKIVVGATECLYDDVELSAPPFPFEQRWDYEAGDLIRKRKGLGKKRKRKQRVQVYEAEEDYVEGDSNFVDDEELNYDDSEMIVDEVADDAEAEQPMPETADDDDVFPALPSDMTDTPDLVEDDLKQGAFIAYKILDMSKDTNWQPIVSEYRVAKIHDIVDDTIRVQLGKEYCKPLREEVEDEEEGRQYSGFEMPGYEDEEEDDGFQKLSFADLIEPKLLRAGDAEEAGKASDSVVGSSPQVPGPVDAEAGDDVQQEQQSTRASSKAGSAGAGSAVPDVDGAAEPNGKESSPAIQSPAFEGFFSPSNSAHSDDGPIETFEGSDENSDDESSGEKPLPTREQTDGNSSESESDDSSDSPSKDASSSPARLFSLKEIIQKHYSKEPPPTQETARESSEQPSSPSSTKSAVPNPFYEIDKAAEERRRESLRNKSLGAKEGDTTMDFLSAAEFLSSPTSTQSPAAKKKASPLPSQDQDDSLIDSVPETNMQGDVKEEPQTQLVPVISRIDDDIVDLTQDSPVASPGGSDFAQSSPMPRGSGWVQKNVPSTRRQTRQSSGRMQQMKEVSISPLSKKGRKRQSRN